MAETNRNGPTLLAFYLPQFHPTPENDAWWGKGFTEWTNTAKAQPLFPGHYQPHIPADLGFYDLRLPEVREEQAALARDYAVDGFCYYHYWFAGRRVLERPFEEVLKSGRPDFPFCLCWANDSWTGVWYGARNRTLIRQTYPGMEDHAQHFDCLANAFSDPRYITIDGCPLLLIFKPRMIPDLNVMIAFWRRRALESGFPGLHLVGIRHCFETAPRDGLDATVTVRVPLVPREYDSIAAKNMPTVISHEQNIDALVALDDEWDYPCAAPNWDNTPRCGRCGIVLHGSRPELFRRNLRQSLSRAATFPPGRQLIFLKSWNEWAEGNHLEPDLKFGRGWLEAVREEVKTHARRGMMPG
jgi:hypothetical protein